MCGGGDSGCPEIEEEENFFTYLQDGVAELQPQCLRIPRPIYVLVPDGVDIPAAALQKDRRRELRVETILDEARGKACEISSVTCVSRAHDRVHREVVQHAERRPVAQPIEAQHSDGGVDRSHTPHLLGSGSESGAARCINTYVHDAAVHSIRALLPKTFQ
eukprot:COSAG01_NODE_18481_length_1073_cov_1.201232_1_plen_160_part_10